MTRLLLVRHGLTDWNVSGRFQGQTDVPLNKTGRLQAEALARRLAGEGILCIYASPLQRARETARIIAAPIGCPVILDLRLCELHFGDWEGLTYEQIAQRQPQALAAWQANSETTPPPGGESLAQLAARASAFLQDIRSLYEEKTVLLAAHGGLLQVMICLALGLPAHMYWKFAISPGSISELGLYPDAAILNALNVTEHLMER